MPQIYNTDTTKCCWGCGEEELSLTAGGKCKMVRLLWKSGWQFLTKLNIISPYDSAVVRPGIDPDDLKSYVHTNPATEIWENFLHSNNTHLHGACWQFSSRASWEAYQKGAKAETAGSPPNPWPSPLVQGCCWKQAPCQRLQLQPHLQPCTHMRGHVTSSHHWNMCGCHGQMCRLHSLCQAGSLDEYEEQGWLVHREQKHLFLIIMREHLFWTRNELLVD